ncbi:MAG: helix-turn-helix transcriptional regulator [Verrucomicrobiota bacterium]
MQFENNNAKHGFLVSFVTVLRLAGGMATTTASLAAQIRRTRVRSKMTQHQFARTLGIRQQKLSEWENGKRLRAVLEAMALLKVLGRVK